MLSSGRALLAAFALAGLGWAGWLGALHVTGRATPLDAVEYAALDARAALFGPRPAPDDVVILAIDDETVAREGQYPLSRTTIATLVSALASAGARVVALDMLFLTPTSPDADARLATALREANAVVAAAATFGPDGDERAPSGDLARIPIGRTLLTPIDAIAAGSGRGIVNLSTDAGGTPRFLPLLVRVGSAVEPALALAAASLAARSAPAFAADSVLIGSRRIPLDLGLHVPLRFFGPAGTIRTIGAAAFLPGGRGSALVRDRIVLVGVTAAGAGDTFATPFDPVMPGVEVIATGIADLVTGGGLARTETIRWIDAAVAIGLTVGLVGLLGFPRVAVGLPAAAVLVAAWLAVVAAAFSHGIWLSVAVPLGAFLPVAALFLLARTILDRRASAALGRSNVAMRLFQQPALADRLARDPGFLTESEEREVAIVFIDLTGFTGLSEAAGPKTTRDLLATFHGSVEDEVNRHGGLVASYQGDGAMILFGLFGPSAQDAAGALATATALAESVTGWIAGLPPALGPLGVKLGAHAGRVSLSRLGHRQHQHITAIGDPVNVASRLMEVAARHGALLAASAEIVAAAGEAASGEPIRTPIRGRTGPLDIYLWRPATGFVGSP